MRKTIKNKILISILAMSSVNLFASAEVFAVDVTVDDNKVTSHNNQSISDFNGYNFINDNSSNNNITVSNSTLGNFYGINLQERTVSEQPYILTNNNITINSSTINGNIIGNKAASSSPSATNLTLTLKDTTVNGEVVDGEVVNRGKVVGADLSSYGREITVDNIKIVLEGNTNINNADVILFRRSTWAIYSVDMSNCEIILRDNADVSTSNLYAFTSTDNVPNDYFTPIPITPQNTTLTLDGWSGTVNSLHDFNSIQFKNIKGNTSLTANTVTGMNDTQIIISSVDITNLGNVKDYTFGTITLNKTITDAINDFPNKIDTTTLNGWNFNDNETNGIYAGYVNATTTTNDNTITITGDIEKSVLTGVFIDENGAHYNSNQNANDHTLTIDNNFKTNAATIAGAYAAGTQNATDGVIYISGDNISYDKTVYAGYSENGNASGNTIYVAADTNASKMALSGGNTGSSQNTLNITGNGSTFESIENFDTINFNGVALNGADVLTLTSANLTNTTLNVESLASGETFKAGDTVTLISGNIEGTPTLTHDKVTAGLSQDLSVEEIINNSSVQLSVKDVSLNDQIDLVAENRAVAAAFVNQGTDLIADSLDTISRDSNYGVKTFAAVHGNRSKYDVNSDIKINGWSTIVGVGNADKFDNGSEFSWGVFYENGSGNYRTYNEFNNDFFRGDGSLVYNGGGIAARYTNKNGVYTEGSLRAGMLKSDMDNALRDGAGNFYGYESESAYYGAHIGVGKIISLNESSDLDVYGKFFHTYTEGDSFKVANDEFEFDSINSDRLRVGARITSNKENKFSTYYGLAYEYEFNSDADMTAQELKAPTQSLQGSSVMAEVGFNYQPTPTSPWSFDLNMRGYTGERQGGSFNVQATYTF